MALQQDVFTPFKESIDSYILPESFTFPFYYQPHPLCVLAAKELQNHLKNQTNWNHNFGIIGNQETAIGKMFGVLLVKNKFNEIGYLSAFSGKLAGKNHHPNFVPPVFDLLSQGSFFTSKQIKINQINNQIDLLEKDPNQLAFKNSLKSEQASAAQHIKKHREKIIEGRKSRKIQRYSAEKSLTTDAFLQLKDKLAQESIKEKLQLRDITLYWGERVKKAEKNLKLLTDRLDTLKKQRKDLSATLQREIFNNYHFLNKKGVSKGLYELFSQTPPAGSGECAAPKLLHYAFQHNMQPLAMAEFWWGEPPKSEIRKHKNFYPACQGKCQPILQHMLEDITMDDNPLLLNPAKGKSITIIYEDESLLVINKPEEFLSVPGKNIEDSVYLRIKQMYPNATGPLTVHRLDMSTSGLMLIALSKKSHKVLQKQFINRTIKKRYIALLDGLIDKPQGVIELPLRVDLDDRPRQLVCYQHGKAAKTRWEVIEKNNNQTKVYFYPITGRTHQLRVHSAHLKGLNTPIVGDDLYGNLANRLHLHADYIEFNHPNTKERIHFYAQADF